jgi:hypothetical protein
MPFQLSVGKSLGAEREKIFHVAIRKKMRMG